MEIFLLISALILFVLPFIGLVGIGILSIFIFKEDLLESNSQKI